MSYLYGDSTPSTLDHNYIEFLRDVMDLMVAIVDADHCSRTTGEQLVSARGQAEKDLEALHDFSSAINQMLESASSGLEPGSSIARCAGSVRTSANDSIRTTANQIKNTLQGKLAELENQMKRDRTGCNSAIERFLLRNDLPGTVHRLELRLDNEYYRARLSGSSKDGLSFVVDLEVPADNLFASPVRVDRVMPDLQLSLPELSGWVRKSVRQRQQKIGHKVVTGLVHTSNESTLRLRANPGDDSGFDVEIARGRVQLVFKGKEADGSTEPFQPDADDAAKLTQLYKEVFAAASAVGKKRVRLVEARIDGKTLAEHETPAVLVQRLVARIAPAVQEISRHSLSPTELVLKRVVDNNRREEIFISKAELMKKLDRIPLALRGVFAPLGLGDLETGNVAAPAPRGRHIGGSTAPPPAAPRAFNTGATLPPPPVVSDDEPTAVAMTGKTATGTITLDSSMQRAPRSPLPRPGARPGPAGPRPSRPSRPPRASDETSGGESSEDGEKKVNIDAAIASLESETG